jgi:signal transduction histidine kinase
VTVVVDHVPDGVRIAVRDDGPGIPAAEREQMFARFHRGADAPPGGTGLGLAIVRAYAEMMDARVELTDNGANGTAAIAVFRAGTPG